MSILFIDEKSIRFYKLILAKCLYMSYHI